MPGRILPAPRSRRRATRRERWVRRPITASPCWCGRRFSTRNCCVACPAMPRTSKRATSSAGAGRGVAPVRIASIYLPNGNPAAGPKIQLQARFMARLRTHARRLMADEKPLVLAGDFNVIPEPRMPPTRRPGPRTPCSCPTPRRAFRAPGGRLHRRPARLRSERGPLHLLGLSGRLLAAKPRHPHRSPAALTPGRRPPRLGLGAAPPARAGEAVGPCAGDGGVERRVSGCQPLPRPSRACPIWASLLLVLAGLEICWGRVLKATAADGSNPSTATALVPSRRPGRLARRGPGLVVEIDDPSVRRPLGARAGDGEPGQALDHLALDAGAVDEHVAEQRLGGRCPFSAARLNQRAALRGSCSTPVPSR